MLQVESALEFWKDYLSDIETISYIPKFYNKSFTEDMMKVDFHFDIELFTELKILSEKFHLELNLVLQAAWVILLSFYSGNNDVYFYTDTPFCQKIASKESIVPLHIKIQNQTKLRSFLENFKQQYEVILPFLNVSRREINEIISTDNTYKFSAILFGSHYKRQDFYDLMNNFEIILAFSFGKLLSINAFYSDTGLERETILSLLENYKTLLESMAHSLEGNVLELNILSSLEKHRVLVEFNNCSTEYPRNKCIQEIFEEQTCRVPENIAVIHQGEYINYRQLNIRANKLAHYLRNKGVGAGTFVGMVIERSVNSVVGILGILKAGGIYVPFDPEYSESRLRYMINDIHPKVLLTQESLKDKTPNDYNGIVVMIDSDWGTIENEDESNLRCINHPDNLAYINYTSGSTGQPKGVMIPHKGVVRLVINTNYIKINEDDCFLHAAPISFDASTFEIWGPLLNGNKMVIVNKNMILSPQDLMNTINLHKVTTMFLTTCLFNRIAEACPTLYSSVTNVITGGDVVSPTHFRRAMMAAGNTNFVHAYGPTENTTFSCCYIVRTLPEGAHTIPIGPPIANSEVYILDKYLRPLPVGAMGEIYVGGEGLARGYYQMTDKTDELFITNPLVGDFNSKIYKTGDLGRWLPTGDIEFCGRIDEQLKIRGFRIEPGEIETALLTMEGIKECVIIPSEVSAGQKRLLAYFVADKSVEPSEAREYLKQILPEYMVPSIIMQIEKIPLTDNGKVDRSALLKLGVRNKEKKSGEEPQNHLEKIVMDIWGEILKMETVGVNENFFELGGDSLLIMKVCERLNMDFQQDIPVVALFQYTTVKELAEFLAGKQLQKPSLADKVNLRAQKMYD